MPDAAEPWGEGDIPAVSAEELVDGRVASGSAAASRRYPSTIGGFFYLLVLGVTLAGLGIVAWGSWRTGITWVGGALIFGACVRLVLSERSAGMLGVRPRLVDAALMGGLGGLLIFLAASIPNQPG
jgi:Protein of unknown function (DUF3017)